MIWYKNYALQDVQQLGKGTMIEHIGIRIIELGDDFIRGTMPVDHRTVQPMGILHGGASVTLAETLGSMAAGLVIDEDRKFCVGIDINANHIRAATRGSVTGTARPLHLGSSTHVWAIEITNEDNRLICISRLTMAILEKKG